MADSNSVFSILDKSKRGFIAWDEFSQIVPELLKEVCAEEVLDFGYELGLGQQQEAFIYQMISNCFLIDYSAPCEVVSGLITSIQDHKQGTFQNLTSSMMKMIGN